MFLSSSLKLTAHIEQFAMIYARAYEVHMGNRGEDE